MRPLAAQSLPLVCGLAVAAMSVAAVGCGASEPREADIYHDPALRPGIVLAADGEGELLARLAASEDAARIDVAGHAFEVEAPYAAASGRRCRAVRGGGGDRLACETDDGWVFVPQVLSAAPEDTGR